MRMGNYFRRPVVRSAVMSTERPTVGVDHPTVVPSNFQPEDTDDDTDDDRHRNQTR